MAALVRNSEGLVGEFVELKGLTLMQNLLRNENVTLAVRRKGLSLVADVALHGSQFIKVILAAIEYFLFTLYGALHCALPSKGNLQECCCNHKECTMYCSG